MPGEDTGMSMGTTGAGGAPSSPAASSTEPGGGGGAGSTSTNGLQSSGSPAAARPDYLLEGYNSAEEQARAFHQQHGSIQEMQQLQEWYNQNYDDLQQWYQSRQQQQQQQQQPQLPKNLGFLQHASDPNYLGAYQLTLANNGQLPENYQNREQMMQRLGEAQQFWDQMYINPKQGMLDLFQLPEIQQAIQQMVGPAVQPIQQQVHQQHVNNLLQTYGPQLKAMHPMAQKLFNSGRFGGGEQAARDALEFNKELMASLGQQPNAQQQSAPPTKEPSKPAQTNGAPSTNGKPVVNGRRNSANDAEAQQLAREAARAKIGMMKSR